MSSVRCLSSAVVLFQLHVFVLTSDLFGLQISSTMLELFHLILQTLSVVSLQLDRQWMFWFSWSSSCLSLVVSQFDSWSNSSPLNTSSSKPWPSSIVVLWTDDIGRDGRFLGLRGGGSGALSGTIVSLLSVHGIFVDETEVTSLFCFCSSGRLAWVAVKDAVIISFCEFDRLIVTTDLGFSWICVWDRRSGGFGLGSTAMRSHSRIINTIFRRLQVIITILTHRFAQRLLGLPVPAHSLRSNSGGICRCRNSTVTPKQCIPNCFSPKQRSVVGLGPNFWRYFQTIFCFVCLFEQRRSRDWSSSCWSWRPRINFQSFCFSVNSTLQIWRYRRINSL